MEPKGLSDTLRMLIERMQTNPEEFINERWDPVQTNAWDDEPFNDVRWANFIRAFYQSGKEFIFDKEEIELLQAHYRKHLRARVEECILKELVGGERQTELQERAKQMDLPYTTSFTGTKRIMTRTQELAEAYEEHKKKRMTG